MVRSQTDRPTQATVRPRVLLRVLAPLVIAPLLIVFGVLFALNVVFPVLFPSGASWTAAGIFFGVLVVMYVVLEFVFHGDFLSQFLASVVNRRWAHAVERSDSPLGWLFYVERQRDR